MKKHRIFSAVVSMLMSFSFLSVMLLSDYELKATADNYESAWFPVNQVRLTQLSFESASHSYSYHIDCVGSQAVGSDYAFAPFTGKIVYLDPSWGYCGLMSTDANGNPRPVHWADGSTDVMVVWFMHGSNVNTLNKGQIITQGTNFFREGAVGASAAHYDIGVSRGQITTPKDQTGHGVGNYCGCGSDYPYNAFFLNRSKTPTIVNAGKIQGRFVGGPDNHANWSGLWKDLNTPPPPSWMDIYNETYPTSLPVGQFFGVYGDIKSNLPIEVVWGGVYNDDWTVTAEYAEAKPNTTSYSLYPYFDDRIIFNHLPEGFYHYLIKAKDTTGEEYKLIDKAFTVGNPARKPTQSTLTADKTSITQGGSITFTATSDTATDYTIGVDRDGKRVVTKPMLNGKLTLPFSEVGTYSAYVTASNKAGGCDSARISFTVSYPDFTVTLNPNGGTVSPTSLQVKYGGTYAGLKDPARNGFVFNGWYADNGTRITADTKVTTAANHSLTAHWTAKTVKVTFHRNQSADDTNTVSESFTYGVSNQKFGYKTDGTGRYAQMNAASVGFGKWTRTGYSLLGWSTDRAATTSTYGTYSSVADAWIDSTSPSVDLYAVWSINSVKIRYHANGGSIASQSDYYTSEDDLICRADKKATLEAVWKYNYTDQNGLYNAGTFKLSRAGYKFVGWSLTQNGGKIFDQDDASVSANDLFPNITQQSGTVTLYAIWKLDIPENLMLKNGQKYALNLPEGFIFKSNQADVAVVSADGTITALGEGTATISVVDKDFNVVQISVNVTAAEIQGDVNDDSKLTVADAILLQKWLMNAEGTALSNWKSADLNSDGRLNAVDLTLLKRQLISV